MSAAGGGKAGGGKESPDGPVVSVDRVSKSFRRYARRPHGTLKSALLPRAARGRRGDADAVPALTDVSFEVPAGQALGIIGSNGSGKSTLLKLLAGILRPTRGTVAVRGRLAALLELGAGFHPEISGRENVEITGLLLGLTRGQIAQRFDEIVAFAGVQEFLDAPVKTYSSGMAVRLGFAIAAASDPDVFLVDEVLAVGDEAFAHRALERFAEFERAGKTLIFVSHDLTLVAQRCRRAIWLDAGRIAADGPAAETVARYREHVAETEGARRLRAASDRLSVGSGAASIRSVRVLDGSGRAVGRLRRGEPATFEMAVSAPGPLTDFVFGFQIATVSGAVVFGTNTLIDGLAPDAFTGEARVALAVPSLDLAAGVYAVDAAVHARDGAPYDFRRDVLRFEVTAENASAGTWSPPRRWTVTGGVRWRA
jgi:lipopolysaccharide transport system ATP-binding protein